ncbi:MAG TPA: pyruvate ferredoxin oxidoreductase [Planctomycetota bacterium]|nr:pyruvate ferredoxin oxidoreductase [Planctomycetota bacterium]
MTVQLISANHASALAATLAGRANRNARGFGGGVYPITPQTECIELLCRQQFDKGSIVRVESEHSAMAVCMGMSIAGARTFTASASNGLAYMAENVYAAAFSRLPIVMMAVNRTLGPPWNIWVDHGDTLMLRDAGWIQLYCRDNQEVADSILFSYRLAEDARVLLPAMVCQDAFVLSHTMMETDLPDQEQVDRFLPELDLPHRIKTEPVMVGGLDFPRETEIHRRQHQEALGRVFEVYGECQDEFEEVFGRRPPDPVVPYRMDDAEIAFVSMGTTASTTDTVVDKLRAAGVRAGSVRVRMYRPFPEQILTELLARCQRIGVLDRDISLGLGGVLWSEVRGCAPQALVQGYMLGLGGGDVRPHHIEALFLELAEQDSAAAPQLVEVG